MVYGDSMVCVGGGGGGLHWWYIGLAGAGYIGGIRA